MKRRTRKQNERARKREARRAAQYKSLGNSRYAQKVKAGRQMYGPAPTKEEVTRLVEQRRRDHVRGR